MDIKDLLDELTEDDIKRLLESIGAEISPLSNSKHIVFTSICHNSTSNKLYFYIESKTFHCYSNCGQIGSLLDLLIHINKYEVKDAINEIKTFFGVSSRPILKRGFKLKKRYRQPTINDISLDKQPTPEYKPYIHKSLKQIPIQEWEEEGIVFDTIKKFDIRYDFKMQQIIIPHHCPFDNERVIGIRCRELLPYRVEKYGKYHPYYFEDNIYSHKLGNNLYGYNYNKYNIAKHKKAILFEGEKGVLQLDSMYQDNIGLALCGSNFSMYQAKLLIKLDIKECVFAMDKQYQTEEEKEIWKNKTVKLASKLIQNNIECYMLLDDLEGLLEHKDAPTDKGKEIFQQLIKNKIKIGETNDKI